MRDTRPLVAIQVEHTSAHVRDGRWHTLETCHDDRTQRDLDSLGRPLPSYVIARVDTFKRAYGRAVRVSDEHAEREDASAAEGRSPASAAREAGDAHA